MSLANDSESIGDGRRGTYYAQGFVNFGGAKVDGAINFAGGHFRHSADAPEWTKALRMALYISSATVKGDVDLCCGFESDGMAELSEAVIGGDLLCSGGRFINPNRPFALTAGATTIRGIVMMGPHPYKWGGGGSLESDGIVFFGAARVDNSFFVEGARFGGKASEQHGFVATGLSVGLGFIWTGVSLENAALLDLTGARVGALIDDEQSWPQAGKLLIDNFTYGSFIGSPHDARSRLQWLALQPGYYPQPYLQLAQVLRASGDDAGAIEVLMAKEDARFSDSGLFVRLWAGFAKATVGYGHRPLRTISWSVAVVLLGWFVVTAGVRAGVMRPTWPENAPQHVEESYEALYPGLYSLDVFLPFVNLHQEHYWWPDSKRSGTCDLFGRRLKISGSFLRHYLWFQIMAGWLLSAILHRWRDRADEK